MKKALAGVVVSPMRIELQEIAIPEITADSALLKVEASSICGSDWPLFAKRKLDPYIIGHENAGYIAKIGSEASRRWGVKEGDRVALEEYIPCGVCAFCRSGNFRDCKATDSKLDDSLRYGKVPVSTAPACGEDIVNICTCHLMLFCIKYRIIFQLRYLHFT